MIFSNSFDNPINVLIAQYFNKTYAVDIRRYQDVFKEDFAFSEYIKEKEIDKVLFVMGPRILLRNKDNKGLKSHQKQAMFLLGEKKKQLPT